MLMISRAIGCCLLLFSSCVYAQSSPLDRRASDFDSKGVGLTETILKFSDQEHIPAAIEYIDRASMDQPIDVNLRGKTIRQALDSILLHGEGYRWRLRSGVIEITNRHVSKHAEGLLNKVIPVFKIAQGETVQMTSTMLWWELQSALDPSLNGTGGSITGNSSTVKDGTLRNQTVREILSYILLNSRAEGWVVAGPPECIGFTPYCGFWYIAEQEPFNDSYQFVLRKVRENL